MRGMVGFRQYECPKDWGDIIEAKSEKKFRQIKEGRETLRKETNG